MNYVHCHYTEAGNVNGIYIPASGQNELSEKATPADLGQEEVETFTEEDFRKQFPDAQITVTAQ